MSHDELTASEKAILTNTLDRLPTPPGPGPEALLAKKKFSPMLVGLAAAAVAVFAVSLPDDFRNKGLGSGPISTVQLNAVAEGPDGIRPLADGATVRAGEWVVFQADASVAGTLTLSEGSTPLGPSWAVDSPGAHFFGGITPLAYRPDEGEPSGPRRYVVELCSDETGCVSADLTLSWAEE